MEKSELNKYLKELNRTELENEIKKLYTKFNTVKKFYELELSQDTSKVLNEFKKISIFQKDLIKLLLHRVETIIEFTKTYGDINRPFYSSIESSYNEVCKLIKREKLEAEYRGRLRKLMNETYHFGWGII
jgi:hypothetical protein